MNIPVVIRRQRIDEPRAGELKARVVGSKTNLLRGRSLTNVDNAKVVIERFYADKLRGIQFEIEWQIDDSGFEGGVPRR